MRKITLIFAPIALAAFISGVCFSAQVKEAWPWPDSMDAIAAAPEFHKVLVENDHIRLLEVTLNPGATEEIHTHRNPSVIVMDSPMGSRTDYHSATQTRAPQSAVNEGIEWTTPQCVSLPSSPPHSVTNTSTYPFHFYRLEYKFMDANDIMKKKAY